MSDEIWNKEFDGETSKYFDVSKALEYNFIDDIVQEAEKVLKIKAQE